MFRLEIVFGLEICVRVGWKEVLSREREWIGVVVYEIFIRFFVLLVEDIGEVIFKGEAVRSVFNLFMFFNFFVDIFIFWFDMGKVEINNILFLYLRKYILKFLFI